jgi:hypothetical protein
MAPVFKGILGPSQIKAILMAALLISLFVCSAWSGLTSASHVAWQSPSSTCRNVPGNLGFPTDEQWATLNTTVSGRLVKVVPFVEFCTAQGGCTAEQFASSTFRATVPGAMDEVRLVLFFQLKLIHEFCSQTGNKLDLSVVDIGPRFIPFL